MTAKARQTLHRSLLPWLTEWQHCGRSIIKSWQHGSLNGSQRPSVLKLLYNNTDVILCITTSGCWFISPLAAACGLYSGRETIHSQCLTIPAKACLL